MLSLKSKYKILIVLVLLISNTVGVTAQERKMKYADRLFNALKYKEAAVAYQELYEKGVKSPDLFQHLGDSYYYNTEMSKASNWYHQLIEKYEDSISPEYYFKYAHSLQGIGKTKEAKKWMRKFSKTTTAEDRRKENYLQAKNNLDAILKLNANYKVFNVSTNTHLSDFGVGFYGNEVVFASAATKDKNAATYAWNKQPFLELYKGYVNPSSFDLEEAKLFSKKLNTQYHESNAVFTKDLKKVFFTRNNYGKKLGDDGKGINHLKLYSADYVVSNGISRWENVNELPFNSDFYSVGHPSLSKDEKQLYFTSDMPGSLGSTDIFVVDILENNTFSAPRNLGAKVNTSGREMFPFIEGENLYFASDGHLGFGGLDVFKSNKVNNAFELPINMGKPINSAKDDFAFVFDQIKNGGYLSSNRDGGKGDDDIYAVIPIEQIDTPVCEQGVRGVVTNILTDERIPNANLELYNELGKKLGATTSNALGQYDFEVVLNCNSRYEVKVAKQGYKSVIKPTLTEAVTGTTFLPLGIETLDRLIVEEKGILKLKIGIIYFDLDKDFIRNDAAIELNKIVLVMSQYPKMHIKIESHTDSRNSAAYNEDLSDRRAKNTREYLVSQGIAASRIESAIGYGEKQLMNRCADGVNCSEQEHELNRRSEFIITKM